MSVDDRDCMPCDPTGFSAFGFRIGISLALVGQSMVFSLGYNNALSAGDAPVYGSPVYWALHGLLGLSALAVIAILGGPLLRETAAAFRSRRLSVEALFVLSGFGAFAGSLISTFRGSGSIYYEIVPIVLCVYAIGKQVGIIQKGRVGEAVSAFRNAFDTAWIQSPDGGREAVPVRQLKPDDRVLIRPGDPVPVDAVIESGRGYLRETALTGEPGPVARREGDRVLAGTWSLDGNLTLRPMLDAPRTIDRILDFLEKAPGTPSRLQVSADRLMQVFVPFVTFVSSATFLGWFLLSAHPWWDALFNAMAVLLVACPCALGLAMPTGIWAGLYHLSQRGLTGRHGNLLDSLASCTTVVFDKTGTLSRFEPGADTEGLDPSGCSKARLVEEIASMAAAAHHPVSEALAKLSTERLPVSDLHIHPGKGLSAVVDGVSIMAGERSLLEAHQVAVSGTVQHPGKAVYIARDGTFSGVLHLREVLREEAEATLEALRQLDCQCLILSGDPAPDRESIGGVVVQAGVSPEDKAARIREWVTRGEDVLFVGDGVNDLPAMQASQAALAIDLGAELATEFADGILVDGRVAVLPHAIRQARHLRKNLQGNLVFALAYNLAGMALAAAGILHPVVAALLMVGSSAFVSWRALRAARSVV